MYTASDIARTLARPDHDNEDEDEEAAGISDGFISGRITAGQTAGFELLYSGAAAIDYFTTSRPRVYARTNIGPQVSTGNKYNEPLWADVEWKSDAVAGSF